MNETLKNILIIGGIILFVIILNEYTTAKDNDDIYTIELNKKSYEICGKNIYISNFTHNDEIIFSELIREIEYVCNYYK